MSCGCDKGVVGVSQAICPAACAGCPHCPTSGGCSEGTRARQVSAACASALPPAHMGTLLVVSLVLLALKLSPLLMLQY